MNASTANTSQSPKRFWTVFLEDGAHTLVYAKEDEVPGITAGLYPGASALETKEASEFDVLRYKSDGNLVVYVN